MQNGKHHLPSFIVIGAMKSGTTSLDYYLRHHPEVGMAKVKEPNFFNKQFNWSRGLSWYSSLFPAGNLVRGEVSPSYSKAHLYPGIPRRIHRIVPRVKIVYVLRHPIQRLVSHVTHAVSEQGGRMPLEEILHTMGDNFILTSCYAWQLARYRAFFGHERICILTQESLRRKREATLRALFGFIGVDTAFTSTAWEREKHASAAKVQRNLLGRVFVANPFMRRLEQTVKRVVPAGLYPLFGTLMGRSLPAVTLPDAFMKRAIEVCGNDVIQLEKMTGKRFSHWGTPESWQTEKV